MRASLPGLAEALAELLGRLDEFHDGVDLGEFVVVESYPTRFDPSRSGNNPGVFALQFFAREVRHKVVPDTAQAPIELINLATFIPDVALPGRPSVQLQGRAGRPYRVPYQRLESIASELRDALTARYAHLPDFDLLVFSGLPTPRPTGPTRSPLAMLLSERGVRYTVSLFETSMRVHQEKLTEMSHDQPA